MAKVEFKTQRPLLGATELDDEQPAPPKEARQPAVPDPPLPSAASAPEGAGAAAVPDPPLPPAAAAAAGAPEGAGAGAAKKPRRRRAVATADADADAGAQTAADAGPVRGPRSISRTVSLPATLWDKLQSAAGEASASSMLVLVLRLHTPKSSGDAGELLEGLLDADELGRQEGLNVRLPGDILDTLDALTVALREAGYSATEATRSNVIASIVLAHAPDTPQAGRELVASERLARLRTA